MSSRAEDLYREIARMRARRRTEYVESWAKRQAAENEYLEFKRVAHDPENQRFWSEALSGFANTEGGLLVWGIGTGKVMPPGGDRRIDVATELKPLPAPASFVQFLQDNHRDST